MTRFMKVMTILNLPYSMTSNCQRSLIQYYEKTIGTTMEWLTMRNSSQRKSGLNEVKNRWYKSRFKHHLDKKKYSRLFQLVYNPDHELFGHKNNKSLSFIYWYGVMCDRQCIWGINTSGVFYLPLLKFIVRFYLGKISRRSRFEDSFIGNKSCGKQIHDSFTCFETDLEWFLSWLMRSCLLKDPSCDSNWFDQLRTRSLAFSFVLCVLLNLPNGPETKKKFG